MQLLPETVLPMINACSAMKKEFKTKAPSIQQIKIKKRVKERIFFLT